MTTSQTHKAVATLGPRTPLQLIDVPTVPATGNLVRVQNKWTASTPLDLHQADGGLLVNPPQVLGDGVAGTVVEIGEDVKKLKVGDEVFGFTWRSQQEKAHQEFVTAPERLFGIIPKGVTPQAAVTLPNNFVTVFHAVTHGFHFDLPWPKSGDHIPIEADAPILIWGGSSSVGQYALQILRYYGYKNLITTASSKHHTVLKEFGAASTVDYRGSDVVKEVLIAAGGNVKYILDCIGSLQGSVEPISQIAGAATIVAIALPVITKDASETEKPKYEMDVENVVQWREGVKPVGIRTHFYLENKFLAEHLQSKIMPAMLANGDVKPNRQRIVEGTTLLERAESALDLLRRKVPSAERLVWRVSE